MAARKGWLKARQMGKEKENAKAQLSALQRASQSALLTEQAKVPQ